MSVLLAFWGFYDIGLPHPREKHNFFGKKNRLNSSFVGVLR